MKIDILTKPLFDEYQKTLSVVLEDFRKEIHKLKLQNIQLQDRLQILERKIRVGDDDES